MAGNKMSSKNKGKDDKSKTNAKPIGQSSEETDEPDFALLRKPILTSITGFGQARKIFDLATEELKDLLSNECDLLYECKVCRNIFRSLANFISHKRVYCKEKFNTSLHGHFIKASSTINELIKIKNLEQGYQKSLRENNSIESKESNEDDRIPLTKDLTAIVEKITKNRGVYAINSEEPQLSMQKIPHSSVAVFQNIEANEDQPDDMRAQVKEIHNILSRDIAVLERDGKFKIKTSEANASENVIQISDDEDNGETDVLKCNICDTQFSTRKTLKFHMKYKHVESRLVYPCPDCLEIFSTSWSVYRHLFKVHRKTAAQIRRLRESIQAKAFKMNNPPASYEKRKNNLKPAPAQKITEEERLDQENQAWMDNMEGDGEVPRCGGCGRAFERRAALAAHTHTCQPRSRALARRPPETKRIEIQIRKDYNKGPPPPTLVAHDTHENKLVKEEPAIVNKHDKEEEKSSGDEDKGEDTPMDMSEDDQKSNDATESPEKAVENKPPVAIPKPIIRLPFAHQSEKSNFMTFRQKISSEIEVNKLLCKRCNVQCGDVQGLYDHFADHLKWVRYACKLCNFKHYSFEKLPEHVKVVHKLKGDKDFYFSTVKAIAGPEALELCETTDEYNDTNETSPDSGRPSRCSSDSSRLSDDSSSSSTRIEGSRKRKLYQSKNASKRRKDVGTKAGEENKDSEVIIEKGTTVNPEQNDSSISKTFEENSSDMDDVDERNAKRQVLVEDTSSVASRRPVRRKAKPKNEDFEYDLSNLLKMEAQGYRDSQSVSNQSKPNQTKRKIQQENQNNYDNVNKDSCGALVTLSKKAVEKSAAHMKTSFSTYCVQKELKSQNIFVRPLIPKNVLRADKTSPKKDINEDRKESSSPNKDSNVSIKTPAEDLVKSDEIKPNKELNDSTVINKPQSSSTGTPAETVKSNLNIPAVLPLKFRRQSLEVIKNPIINKNISDFTKAGMKTKILVIKPINRNKDGKQAINTPLKFQTIKLKDPNKTSSSSEDKSSDQVVVVKVPKVDCANSRLNNDACTTINEKQSDSNLVKTLEMNDDQHDNLVNKEVVNDSNCNGNGESDNNNSKADHITTKQSDSSSLRECADKDDTSVLTIPEPPKNVNTTL